MYQVTVNDRHQFEIDIDKDVFKVNNEIIEFDALSLKAGHSNVLYQHKSYNVEVIAHFKEEKIVELKVNGRMYRVSIEDQYDQLLKQLGLDNLQASKVHEIKAPMPGLVLKVLVAAGQEVKKGDNLLVLEAMKMENIIKSSTNGSIKAVNVNQGDKVEKNTVLLQFS